MAIRAPVAPDPNPTTANANPSAHILRQTNELSDGDFASITSGTGISSMVTQQTTNLGGAIGNQNQLPNMAAGRGTARATAFPTWSTQASNAAWHRCRF